MCTKINIITFFQQLLVKILSYFTLQPARDSNEIIETISVIKSSVIKVLSVLTLIIQP